MAVAVAAWSQDYESPVSEPENLESENIASGDIEPENIEPEEPVSDIPAENVPAEIVPQAPAPVIQKVRAKKVRPPYEHRGFFFSMGMGFSYTSTSYEEKVNNHSVEYYDGYSGWVTSSGAGVIREEYYRNREIHCEFSGWSYPALDFRFGKSIGNLVAIYTIVGGGVYQGDGDYSRESYEGRFLVGTDGWKDDAYYSANSNEPRDGGAFGVQGLWGLGFSVYPFRNPSSPLNGLYVSVSSGVFGFSFQFNHGFTIVEEGGIFSRYELGKDWWVSETWALGVGVGYTNMAQSFADDGDYSSNTITFFIRLTHG